MFPQQRFVITAILLLLVTIIIVNADPGIPPMGPAISSSGTGNILIYNYYTSSASNPVDHNTRINLTNISEVAGLNVHLFFVDGDTCSVADNYICLTKSQTTSFLASDIDPGVTGYIIAIATDNNGLPIDLPLLSNTQQTQSSGRFRLAETTPLPPQMLIGSEYVKTSAGSIGNLGAEAIIPPPAAEPTPTPSTPCLGDECPGPVSSPMTSSAVSATSSEVTLVLRNLPRVLAVSSIPSRADGNETLLIVNRIGGDLRTTAGSIGNLFGILFDEFENPYSWTVSGGCQLRRVLSNSFPRIAPRFDTVIPAGSTGWMKFWSTSSENGVPNSIVGSIVNFNPNTGSSAMAYNQGHNLHKLTLNPETYLTIPVFPPGCVVNRAD